MYDKDIVCTIEQVDPLPFMKRWNVYDVIEGKKHWVARFKDEEDAVHFCDYRWGKPFNWDWDKD